MSHIAEAIEEIFDPSPERIAWSIERERNRRRGLTLSERLLEDATSVFSGGCFFFVMFAMLAIIFGPWLIGARVLFNRALLLIAG